jgi:hypothetical protein
MEIVSKRETKPCIYPRCIRFYPAFIPGCPSLRLAESLVRHGNNRKTRNRDVRAAQNSILYPAFIRISPAPKDAALKCRAFSAVPTGTQTVTFF